MKSTITCPICNKDVKQLTNKHIKTHGLTITEFKKLFQSVPLISEEVRLKNQQNSLRGSLKAVSKIQQNKKERIQQYIKNPSLCKYCDIVIPYEKRHNQFCSQSCGAKYNNSRRVVSETTKRKISQKLKCCYSGAAKQHVPHKHSPKEPKICSDCGDYFIPKTKTQQYCSVVCRRRNFGGYNPNSTIVHRSFYKGFQMDSGAERVFAEIMDSVDINWFKNTKQYFEFSFQNKIRKYYPDFFLPDFDLWVEIKGQKYIREGDQERLESVGNIIRIMSQELKNSDHVISRIFSKR